MKTQLLPCLFLMLCTAALAPLAAPVHAGTSQAAQDGATADMAEGEIKKIDKDAGKLTIKHGELKHLGMMPMTMVFRVKDASMLDVAPVGAKVHFSVEKINGALTVIALQAMP